MMDAYDRIPLLPQRKPAPTPVVPRTQIASVNDQSRLDCERSKANLLLIFYALLFKNPSTAREWAYRCLPNIYGVTTEDIKSTTRRAAVARARRDISGLMYALFPDRTLQRIAWDAGLKDHSTVLHHVRALGVFEPRQKPCLDGPAKSVMDRAAGRQRADKREELGYPRSGPMPKLTPKDVLHIRRTFDAALPGRKRTAMRELACFFGVDIKHIERVSYRASWKHLPDHFEGEAA